MNAHAVKVRSRVSRISGDRTTVIVKRKPSTTPVRRALMEELEPRLLFSADLPGVLA
jgi:hypothetical protein